MVIKPPHPTVPTARPAQATPSQERAAAEPASVLQLLPGQLLKAQVEQLLPITQEQRQQLLAAPLRAMLELTQATTPEPGARARFNQLLEQQQLLNTPGLLLARLRVAPQQVLLVYTDQPLRAGQQLSLSLDANQRLLLKAIEPLPGVRPPATAPGTPAGAAESSRVAPGAQPAPALTPDTTRELLAGAMRLLLPQKDLPDLLPMLPLLRALPGAQRQLLLDAPLERALANLERQLPDPGRLSNPTQLKQQLHQSGQFFEQQLSQQRPAAGVVAPGREALTQDLKGALLQVLQQVHHQLPANHRASAVAGPGALAGSVAPPAPAEAKPDANRPDATRPELALTPRLDLQQLLLQLPGRPRAELSSRVLKTQLMLLLQQYTLATLAKVQVRQLHNLSQRQGVSDAPQATQSWSFELPVRLGAELRTLELRIEGEPEETDTPEQRSTRRRWRVNLDFDLGHLGRLHAQLTVLDQQIAARFWAEQDSTLALAQSRLARLQQQLQEQALEVTHLQCVAGAPPSARVSLNYSLVDVTT